MVTVESKLKVPVELHLSRLIPGDVPGELVARRVGGEVTLRPGLNAGVDQSFWSAWCAQHRGEPLADHFVVVEEEPAADPLLPDSPPSSGGLSV